MEKSDPNQSKLEETSQPKDLSFGSFVKVASSDFSTKSNINNNTSKCSSKQDRENTQWLLGRWNNFCNSFSKKMVHRKENNKQHNSENFTLDTIFKKVKRSENMFTKIKRFYRSITEDDYQPESDHSEPAEVILESKLIEDDEVLSESHSSKESENDLLTSFSTLSVKIRNDELDKMHDVLKRYRDKETRLTEKLTQIDEWKVQEYDYFPKIGEKDHDIWDLKTKLIEDDTMEYLKILFFRDSEIKEDSKSQYDLRDIQVSLDKVRDSDGILVDRFGIEINTTNISCLMDTNWLNDEIINFYLQILQEQNDLMRLKHDLPSCYFFNTFFFQALCGNDVPGVFYDYKSVARWTKRKKVNIFEKDLLIIPVHVSKVHWALGVIDMRNKWRRIMIFDSLGGTNPIWFKNIKRWLQDEHLDKMNKKLTQIDEWKVPKNYSSEPYTPSQKNSYDCGLFLCQFAKCISFAKGFDFTNESSSYLRNMMIHEILSCKVEV